MIVLLLLRLECFLASFSQQWRNYRGLGKLYCIHIFSYADFRRHSKFDAGVFFFNSDKCIDLEDRSYLGAGKTREMHMNVAWQVSKDLVYNSQSTCASASVRFNLFVCIYLIYTYIEAEYDRICCWSVARQATLTIMIHCISQRQLF